MFQNVRHQLVVLENEKKIIYATAELIKVKFNISVLGLSQEHRKSMELYHINLSKHNLNIQH